MRHRSARADVAARRRAASARASEEADVLLDAHLLDLGELVKVAAAHAEHLDKLRLGEVCLELRGVDARRQLPPHVRPDELVLDYSQLVWSDEGRQLPPGVNAAKLEAHLSAAQFVEVLGMARDDFYTLSKVEQMRIKQDVGLF